MHMCVCMTSFLCEKNLKNNQVCITFKTTYFEYKAKAATECPSNPWRFQVYMIMYMYMYLHVCMHMYLYMYTYIHTYIHTFMHTFIHNFMHTFIHTFIIHTYAS